VALLELEYLDLSHELRRDVEPVGLKRDVKTWKTR
jgi:hypothetical protein